MARKSRTRYTVGDVRKHLEQLETLYGSQKAAAEKLGVGVSTYREYKSGRKEPPKEKQTLANRLFGRNKKKLSDPEYRTKHEKRIQQEEKKRQARETQKARAALKPVIRSARDWIYEQFTNRSIIQKLLLLAPEYVAYLPGDPTRVQFLTAMEAMSPNQFLGKPPRRMKVWRVGILSDSYQVELMERQGLDPSALPSRDTVQTLYESRNIPVPLEGMYTVTKQPVDMLSRLTQHWSLGEVLDDVERKFFETLDATGRRRLTPIRFVGYQL